MKKVFRALGIAAALVISVSIVHAMGPGGKHGGKWGGGDGDGIHSMFLRGITLTADQQQQVQAIRDQNRAQFHDLFQQLRTAHESISDKLMASGPVDPSTFNSDVTQIASLRQQLLTLEMNTTVAIRNVLTPDQLTQVAARHAKMKELKSEMHQVMSGQTN